MATILFSSLTNGSTTAFNPAADVFFFDDATLTAASVIVGHDAGFTTVTFTAAGKTVGLTATVNLMELTTGNVTFDDGSQLLIGDNSTNANDVLANTLIAGAGNDHLLGLSGVDVLVGGAGNDLLDGGLGADAMKGGLGSDTYLVDDAGDVVDETPTVDTLLVSTDTAGTQGDNGSQNARISADGRYVVFESLASNLVGGDDNAIWDVFVKDLQSGAIQRVSTDAAGVKGNLESHNAQFSADGRYVLFDSSADNLVAGDSNFAQDIFVKDLQTGAIQRVSTDAAGVQGNSDSLNAQFSADGRYVVFVSVASNLVAGDSNGDFDIFVKDLQTGAVQRVSTDAAGIQGNSFSLNAQFSADGRYVVFDSPANNLVAGDSAGAQDVFIKDLQTGAIQRVSTDAAGVQANSLSQNAHFSADGRYVLFQSVASNLVAGDSNGDYDIFVKDLQTGAVQRVSTDAAGVQGNSFSLNAQFSADGRYVLFESFASNLVAGDTNAALDAFVKDLQTGAVQRVSTDAAGVQGNFQSANAQFSADGRYVVFDSVASNLVAGDSNGTKDIFRVANPFSKDNAVDTVKASVSYTLADAVENLTLTGASAINGTGNALANKLIGNSGSNLLDSGAGNDILNGGAGADTLKGGLGNDTYVVDNIGDTAVEQLNLDTTLVSRTYSGSQGNDLSTTPSISADGRYVVFESLAGNLVAGDSNGTFDVFVKDLQTGVVSRVSTSAAGVEANFDSFGARFSADDHHVVFTSLASNLVAGDGNFSSDIFVKDLQTGAIQRVSTDAAGAGGDGPSSNASASADGHYVAFHSLAGNLVEGDIANTNNVFIKDMQTGAIECVSRNSAGDFGNNASFNASLSADGRYVAFGTDASNLVAGDTNALPDVYVKDLQTGELSLASISGTGVQGNNISVGASISADGRYVVFYSIASNLVTGDTNASSDVFVQDLQTGAMQRVSTASNGVQGNAESFGAQAAISADGRYVLFESSASNLVAGDSNGVQDIFVKDLQSGAIQRVSTDAAGVQGNTVSQNARFSADGRYLVFDSNATNLVAGDGNATTDVFRVLNPFLETGGTDTVQASVSRTLDTNVENLILTGAAAINGTGNAQDNRLTGNSGNNLLDGGAGADTMSGGAGNDTYVVDNVGDRVVETASVGSDTVQSSVSYSLGANVEKLTLTGAAAINATGNALNNTLTGNTGINVLDGGAGADTMTGGAGNDTYVVDNAADLVTELAGGGIDTIQSSRSYTLGAEQDNLTLTGSAALAGTGNALNNTLTGNSGNNALIGDLGNDILIGGLGNDSLDGGIGTDTASYAGATVAVQVNLSLAEAQATGMGSDTLLNIENLTGSSLDDTLIGNAGANVINGGAGLDLLIGLAGNDTYVIDNAGDKVIEYAAGGTDTVQSSVSFTLGANIENLTLTGSANLTGVGNAQNNTLTGNVGSNFLDGDAGVDTVSYATATAAITASLVTGTATGAGTDFLVGIENLTGGSGADTLTGDANANVLNGGTGNDTLAGGAGDDTYVINAATDIVTEAFNAGIDTIQTSVSYSLVDTDGAGASGGNVENLTLTGAVAIDATGNSLGNVLTGNGASNILDGGAGNDTLVGGLGADAFVFSTVPNAATNKDTISDFVSATDKIRIDDAAFANIGALGNFAAADARFFAGSAAHDANDRIIYDVGTGALSYDADGNGAGIAVQFAIVGTVTHPAVSATDLVAV